MTITAITQFLVPVLLLILAATCWAGICNERTYWQRSKLLKKGYSGSDWREFQKHFDQVDYNQHWSALFFFRDPMKLYDHEEEK